MKPRMRASLLAQYLAVILILFTPIVLELVGDVSFRELVGFVAWPFLVLVFASIVHGSLENRTGVSDDDS